MKSLRKYSMLRESSTERAFSMDEIKIFKFLNREKNNLKTKDDLVDYIKKILEYLGFDKSDASYYYYLYSYNYRPDGDYENIMKGQEYDLSQLRTQRTPNYKMGDFAKVKIPFKANNVEGFWEKDRKGVSQYVITSYGWYPIYIFKDGKWFEVSDRYSSSTSKQMRQTHPSTPKNLVILTQSGMNQLRNGIDPEKIYENDFIETFEFLKEKIFSKNVNFATVWNYSNRDEGLPSTRIRIRYNLNYIDIIDGKITIDLDVNQISFLDFNGNIISNTIPDNINQNEFEKAIEDKMKYEVLRYKILEPSMRHLLNDEKIELIINFEF